MDKYKKVIVLDMDETLEHGMFKKQYSFNEEDLIMVLRPNLDKLINKLKEVKKQGIDIILCTTARDSWVERFLNLKPEFRDVFDKKYTRDNEKEWREYCKEKYPIEYKAQKENINLERLKPITTFGYDSVLYIDDNKIDNIRLKLLFEIGEGKLEKDVTHFTAFGFYGGRIEWLDMLVYEKLAKINIEFSQILEEYLETERNNKGCEMMCLAIDEFVNKEFKIGLNLIDDDYVEENNIFNKKLEILQERLEKLSDKLKNEIEKDILDLSKYEVNKILNTDKKSPYEGIEVKPI